VLAGLRLIWSPRGEAGATPPPKGKRDSESLRNNEETMIPGNSTLKTPQI
jgi:hypothetical protein